MGASLLVVAKYIYYPFPSDRSELIRKVRKTHNYLPAAPLPWFLLVLLPLPRPLRSLTFLPRISSGPSSRCFRWGADLLDAPLELAVSSSALSAGWFALLGGLVATICLVSLTLFNKGLLWCWTSAVVSILSFSLSWSLLVALADFWFSSEDKSQKLVSRT